MRRFQTAFLATVAAIGFASVASAANMPTKAPITKAPIAAPLNDWSGFYIGGGIGWAHTGVGGDYVITPTVNHHNVSGDSAIFSGIVGIQHQWNRVVLGVEADFSGTTSGWPASRNAGNADCLASLSTTITCRGRTDQIFTVGPRVGFVAANQWLLFATGGYASAKLETSVVNHASGNEIGHSSVRHDGWFAGGGVE